jgi:hypothetical protein
VTLFGGQAKLTSLQAMEDVLRVLLLLALPVVAALLRLHSHDDPNNDRNEVDRETPRGLPD